MNSNIYCVIMAGGIGTRFWPKSRRSCPKQFLDILGSGKSFIRHTFERLLPLVGVDNILVVTNEAYRSLVEEHIPEIGRQQILCEPIGRNTAPCVAYAAYYIASKDPDAQMLIAPSDHHIIDEDLFRSKVSRCLEFVAAENRLMTIGIKPTRPESGFGYIQLSSSEPITKVKCFTEKPSTEMAQVFLDSGEFMWNSGIFIWSARSIIEAFRLHMPELHTLFSSIGATFGTPAEKEAITRVFSQCKTISIDYGIMEKSDNVYVTIGDFGWSDIGTWGSLFEHVETDSEGNIATDRSYLYETYDSVISTTKGKTVVVSGLSEYIVVDSHDVLMICPRAEEQNIKKFIEDIKYREGEEHL